MFRISSNLEKYSQAVYCWAWSSCIRWFDRSRHSLYYEPRTIRPRRCRLRWVASARDQGHTGWYVVSPPMSRTNTISSQTKSEQWKAWKPLLTSYVLELYFCPVINTSQYAPVSGTVEAINEALSSEPNLLNKSAENKGRHGELMACVLAECSTGWLCKIKLSDPSEVNRRYLVSLYHAHVTDRWINCWQWRDMQPFLKHRYNPTVASSRPSWWYVCRSWLPHSSAKKKRLLQKIEVYSWARWGWLVLVLLPACFHSFFRFLECPCLYAITPGIWKHSELDSVMTYLVSGL